MAQKFLTGIDVTGNSTFGGTVQTGGTISQTSGNILGRGYLNLQNGYGSANGIYLYGNPAMYREDANTLFFPLRNISIKNNGGGNTKFVRIWNTGTADGDDAVLSFTTQSSRTYSIGTHRDSGAFLLTNADASVASGELLTIDMSGNATFAGHVSLADGKSGRFGDSNDLKLYHASGVSYIENDTGDLNIIQNNGSGEMIFTQNNNDGNINFNCDDGSNGVTTYMSLDGGDTDINVYKDLHLADSINIRFGTGLDARMFHDGSNTKITNGTGGLYLGSDTGIGFQSADHNTTFLTLTSSAATFTTNIVGTTADFQPDADSMLRIRNAGTDAISIFADTGDTLYLGGNNTTGMYLDASADAWFVGEVRIADSKTLKVGAGGDLQLYHDGSHSYIQNWTGSWNFRNYVTDGNTVFAADNGQGGGNIADYFYLDGGSATHNGSITTAMYTIWKDYSRIALGNSKDLQIYHDGSHSYIQDTGTGHLMITGSQVQINSSDNSENMATFAENGSVNLYNNGVLQAGTMSDGWQVPATKGVYFDGGAHTYIKEISADRLGIYSGGRLMLDIFESGDASSYIDMHAPTVGIHSSEASDPHFFIKNTNADANPPRISLIKDSASPADNDETGRIYMYGDNDAGEQIESVLIRGMMTDVSDGSEDSKLEFYTYAAGSQGNASLKLESHNATFADGVRVDGGDLILGDEAYSLSASYVGIKTAHQSGSTDYMMISGTTDGNTYISAKSGSNVYIRGGGNDDSHQLIIGPSSATFSSDLTVGGYVKAGTYFSAETVNNAYIRFKHGSGSLSYVGASESLTGAFGDENDMLNYTDGKWGVYTSSTLALTLDESQNATFAGHVALADDKQIQLGNLSGGDIKLYHVPGVASYFLNKTDDLRIINQADDKDIIFETDNGSGSTTAYLTLDGSAGVMNAHVELRFPDSIKAKFGTNQDLLVYHDGTSGYINNSTGSLYIQNGTDDNDIYFQCDDGSGGLANYFYLDGSTTKIEVVKEINSVNHMTLTGDGKAVRFYPSSYDN